MIRMPRLVLGCVFCLAAMAVGRDLPGPKDAALKGLRFATPEQAVAVLNLLAPFNRHRSGHPNETMRYALKTGPLGIFSGSLARTIRLIDQQGRPAYQIRETAHIWNRSQESEALLDAASLLPLSFTRTTRRGRKDVIVHEILWDHLDGTVFGQVTRNSRVTSRHDWKLGHDLPAETRDPLSAFFVYRVACGDADKVLPWEVPVLDGCTDRYACRFTPQGKVYTPGTNLAGAVKARRVTWLMTPIDSKEDCRRVTFEIGLGDATVPLLGSEMRWGWKGNFSLKEYQTGTAAQ